MVDHQKLSFFCLFASLHHKAVVVMIAIGAETVFTGTCHFRPNAGILRNISNITALAGHRLSRKLFDAMKMNHFFTRFSDVGILLQGMLEALLADIVGAAFKERHATAHSQRF